jgi:phospho-N-acetylmuramoyl-pentapeptide-transferase
MVRLPFVELLGRYPTYQVLLAVVLSLTLSVLLFPFWIRLLKVRQVGQQVRADGPQGHLVKQGTPTMGGVLILIIVVAVYAAMGRWSRLTVLAVGLTIAAGLMGFVDDYFKVAHERSLGLTPRAKLLLQGLLAVIFGLLVVNWGGLSPKVWIPLFGGTLDLGVLSTTVAVGGVALTIPWLYLALVFVMVVGSTNGVNLTDGLDGLAAGTVTIVTLSFASIAFRQDDLSTALLGATIAGACIGFLWYNAYPADIFMGDTGSLALGAAVAAMAIITKSELLLILIGAVYVAETLSVIGQVTSFKLFRRRILRMAPLHHHFEMLGWSETQVMVRFWILTGVTAGAGIALFIVSTLQGKS